MSLPTPTQTVETLQTSLQTKAKAEPAFRFYALWDKVCREDVLAEAYRRCRANAGAAGVDGETFGQIDAQRQERWLETLREELTSGRYAPSRSCACGYRRATEEASGLSAFRAQGPRGPDGGGAGHRSHLRGGPTAPAVWPAKLDAKMALRRVYWHVTQLGGGRWSTRIARLLHLDPAFALDAQPVPTDRRWSLAPHDQGLATAPVRRSSADVRADHRSAPDEAGCAQGGLTRPGGELLLPAPCCRHGKREPSGRRRPSSTADDLASAVDPATPSRRWRGWKLDDAARAGGEHGQDPDRPAARGELRLPRLHGRPLHGRDGRAYIGTRSSWKAVKSLLRRIHQRTNRQWYTDEPESRLPAQRLLRGWCGYFDQGRSSRSTTSPRYTERQVRRWLLRRSGR